MMMKIYIIISLSIYFAINDMEKKLKDILNMRVDEFKKLSKKSVNIR